MYTSRDICYIKLISGYSAVICDLPLTLTSHSIHIIPAVVTDPENVGIGPNRWNFVVISRDMHL